MPDFGNLRYVEPSLQPASGQFSTPYYAAYTNSGDLAAATYAAPGQRVRLVDPKSGSVLYEGTGPEGAKYVTGLANALSEDKGRKAAWAIQLDSGNDQWTTTGLDKKDPKSLLSKIAGGALSVAAAPFGLLGKAVGQFGVLGDLLDGKDKSSGGYGAIDSTAGTLESLNPIFRAKLPDPTFGVRTPREMPAQDWSRYGMGPEQAFFDRAPAPVNLAVAPATLPAADLAVTPTTVPTPVTVPAPVADLSGIPGFAVNLDDLPVQMAHGGSFAVRGDGDGRSDGVPAELSDGEYVIDAETVALLGNGSSNAGAKALDDFRVAIRKHKGRDLAEGRFSKGARSPESYMRVR